jgi:hypothetical protein
MPYRTQQPLTAALARALHPKYRVLSMDGQACRPIA